MTNTTDDSGWGTYQPQDHEEWERTATEHAKASAKRYFQDSLTSRQRLIEGPDIGSYFDSYIRERSLPSMDFRNTGKHYANWLWDRYAWALGYEYRRLLVETYPAVAGQDR